jgi:hypothetical protein
MLAFEFHLLKRSCYEAGAIDSYRVAHCILKAVEAGMPVDTALGFCKKNYSELFKQERLK